MLGSGLLVGCGREKIQVYRVPKPEAPPMEQAEMPADHPDATAASPQLKWQTPAGWTEVAPSEMRVASFKVAGKDGQQADVSVIPLTGTAGGELSNVNRWRNQVGQPPVSEDEMRKLAQPVEVAGQPATLYEQNNESTRILAVLQQRGDLAWFFKMTGDNQLVAQAKPAFVAFLKSVQFSASAPAPEMAAAPNTPQWNAPADWTEAPAGQFLAAKFEIAGGQAAVNISSSSGEGGGVAPNINRWRRQLGLPALEGAALTKTMTTLKTASGQATLAEMSGADARSGQPTSLVGVIVLLPGQAWFYKLMGNEQIVAAQKAAFTKFVSEVKY